MVMVATQYHSADMVRDLISETRHWPRFETVHGELLVTPAPRPWHQEIVGRLYEALRAYTRTQAECHVFISPADVSWGLPDVLVQPDVFVVPLAEARSLDWRATRTLQLAVEVLSSSSVRSDRFTKRRLYQEQGVPLYWIIDLNVRAAEIWTPADAFPRVEHEELRWHSVGASEPFSLRLCELFQPF